MGLTGSGTMGAGLTNGGCLTGPTNKIIINKWKAYKTVRNNQTGHLKSSYQLKEDLLKEVEMVHVSGLGVYDL